MKKFACLLLVLLLLTTLLAAHAAGISPEDAVPPATIPATEPTEPTKPVEPGTEGPLSEEPINSGKGELL